MTTRTQIDLALREIMHELHRTGTDIFELIEKLAPKLHTLLEKNGVEAYCYLRELTEEITGMSYNEHQDKKNADGTFTIEDF